MSPVTALCELGWKIVFGLSHWAHQQSLIQTITRKQNPDKITMILGRDNAAMKTKSIAYWSGNPFVLIARTHDLPGWPGHGLLSLIKFFRVSAKRLASTAQQTARVRGLLLLRSLSHTTRLCFGNDIKAGCECGARIYQSAAADPGASRFGSVVDELELKLKHTRSFQLWKTVCVSSNSSNWVDFVRWRVT